MSRKQDAPGGLELVRAFVNTRSVELGTDEIDSPPGLTRWLAERGLLEPEAPGAGESETRRALELREALRRLLLANSGATPSVAAFGALNLAGRRGRFALSFTGEGVASLEPAAKGVDGALARLVAVVYEAIRDGSWERMKACRDETCEWAFYDSSKNRSGAWCSMDVCGNRNKVRLFRTRARAEP